MASQALSLWYRQTTMSEELPREEGLPEESEESERWISSLFSALTPQHRKYLLFPWNEVPKVPEETPATEAEADVPREPLAAEEPEAATTVLCRKVRCCVVLLLFFCTVVAFAALVYFMCGIACFL